MPMYKPVVERWPKRAPSLAWIFYFLAFVVAGAWHGTTLNYLLYGAWQGMGCSATKVYENWLLARFGRKGLREYLHSSSMRGGDLPEPAVPMRLDADLFAAGRWQRVADVAKSVLHPDGTFVTEANEANHESGTANSGPTLGIVYAQASVSLFPAAVGRRAITGPLMIAANHATAVLYKDF